MLRSSVRLFSSKCSVRGFASHQCKFHFDSMYGVLIRNSERQKNHRNFLGDRLELWPSKHTLQMVNNSKDKNGSLKLIESVLYWSLIVIGDYDY